MAKDITKLKHRLPVLLKLGGVLANNWLIFLLIAFTFILSFLNYQPGTFLTGWDNLHPEYNFAANIKRSLFAVWQEYQSLGLLGGHAHATDLLRQLFLAGLSAIFPINILRYLWTFFMLTLGPLGVYVFLNNFFLKHKFDDKTIHFASFLGGFFYLLNLSTVQHFFTPFETFTAFYGFFPWLIITMFYFLAKPNFKRFLVLFLINLLASPAYYTETMFVVYGLCLLVILADFIYFSRHRLPAVKESFFTLIGIGLANVYWLLPTIFFVATNGGVGLVSKVNTIATSETYYRNLAFGNLTNLALLRGFWFDFLDLAGGAKFDYLMLPWKNHSASPIILTLGLFFFILIITGAIYSFSKKLALRRPVLGIVLLCLFFLLGGGFLINNRLPLIGELFRSPFTKFSTVLAFGYSIFFSVGCIFLLDLFSFLHSRLTYYLTLFTVTLALIIFMTPAFTGNLISPTMRLKVPDEYFELFDFFKNQDPATRIANFPQYTFWGWNYYSWGYRGSGFLWYGIKQPILDRAFDVWEKTSEKYYEEISTALYNEDQGEFEALIDKYAINWLLIDRNVIAPSENIDLGLTKLQQFIDNSGKFALAKNIEDKILVYKTNVDKNVKNFLSLGKEDSTLRSPLGEVGLRPIKSPIQDGQIILTHQLTADGKQLNIPSYTTTENLIPNAISYRKTPTGFQLKLEPVLPEIKINDQIVGPSAPPVFLDFALQQNQSGLILSLNDQFLELQLPDELTAQTSFYPLTYLYLPSRLATKISVYSNVPDQKLDLSTPLSRATPNQCYTNKPNRKVEKIVAGKSVSLFGTDLVACLSTPIPQTDFNHLLSLEFTYQSATGTPANAAITNRDLGGENSPQALLPQSEPTFTRVYARPLSEPMQANLILEANESKSAQEITYKNTSVSYLPLLAETSFTPHQIEAFTLPSTKDDSLTIALPIIDNPFTQVVSPDNNLLNPSPRNCDNFNSGKFDRITSPEGFLYSSQNANSCDQLNLKHLPHDINYAILIDSQNQAGLSPTVCLENYSTRRCDVYERLIDGPQLVIQPISNPNELSGYTLHLSNQSFGNRPTKNLIRSIVVTPLPLNFLRNITLTGFSWDGDASTDDGSSQVKPTVVSSHPAEFLYLATLRSPEGEVGPILNLYQTHSPYWKALEVSESDLKLPLWALILKLPHLYVFGNPDNRLLHNDADSWHNSWVLPAPNVAAGEVGPTHHLVIFYLPQYLEFIGLILLPAPALAFLVYILFIRKKSSIKK